MLSGAIGHRYAQALFDIALEANLVDEFAAQLKLAVDTISGNAQMQEILHHPHISPANKKDLLTEVFKDSFSRQITNFLNLLVDRRRLDYLGDIYEVYKTLVDVSHNIVEVQVKGAVALDDAQKANLSESLTKVTGKSVRLVAQVDPSLIGGVVVKIGDRVIDGSVAGRLAKLKQTLV